jgi:DNA-binding YbaB/EbfC family protein
MKNIGDLQRIAQKMQAEMQKAQQELAEATVEGSAGGGVVTVVMTGAQEIRAVRIERVAGGDVEMLQDLVLAAVADALKKSKELAAQRVGGITGGLNLPGLS